MAGARSLRCQNAGNRQMLHDHSRTGPHTGNRCIIESVIEET